MDRCVLKFPIEDGFTDIGIGSPTRSFGMNAPQLLPTFRAEGFYAAPLTERNQYLCATCCYHHRHHVRAISWTTDQDSTGRH